MTRAFDVCGPLPTGVTVLEASAGTGKTFTIAGLTARYVADGIPLDRLLLVTFTRMATAELRDRVRERLVTAEHGLARALAGVAPDARDEVLRLLADGTREEVEERRRRLEHALADFDAATIVTTHGFCQEVLGGLGIAGDLEPDATFVEDVTDLVDEIVDDLYVRRFLRHDDVALTRKQAAEIAHEVVRNPGAGIEPVPSDGDTSPPATRARLAQLVVRELGERKRARRLMTYDDLLTRLHDVLVDEDGGPTAERLRERYDVVLIDEFQDTDPVQWGIVERAFGRGGTTLVLIGDPKQAIYAFRGAEVNAYLRARAAATTTETLGVNWRSDQGLIDAYDQLFGGAELGDPGIVYRPVRAAPAHVSPRLSGAPVSSPLRVRVVPRGDVGTTQNGYAQTDPAREHIARDLADDVIALLSSGALVEVRADDGHGERSERVEPGHIAVLVRRNRDAELVRDALDAAGVPAVLNGAGSVFATEPAADWLRLLEALERPTHVARVRAAALTPFFGWSAREVACAEDEAWEDVRQRLHRWAALLRAKGVAALAETITLVEGLPSRMLARVDGERALTDLRHVAQLLHGAAMEEQLGVAALTQWLRARIEESDVGDEERSRRLESDAEAVQVLTIHRSKGLEFPIVYAPFLWHPTWVAREAVPVTYHDSAGERRVDVGLIGRSYNEHKARHLVEQRGEDLRLAYVALTRARHQAVVWWAGTRDSRDSALGRLVFCRGADGSVPDSGSATPSDEDAVARLRALADSAPGCVSVEMSRLGTPASWSPPLDPPASLGARSFDRELDLRWRRTSYSDITAGAYEARVASEPEDADVVADEDEPDLVAEPPPVESPLAAMPGGVHVGTFVHRVLEAADFTAGDVRAELRAHVDRSLSARRVDVGDPDDVVAGLTVMLETPLGPVLGDVRLRDVTRADRLDELAFELPLVGGDDPHGRVGLSEIAAVLRRDPDLADYAERLGDPGLRRDVRGYLAGAIDLVVRLPDGRFAIVDYKTNRLEGFDQDHLAREMRESHYLLQALLYVVALHRYLRWRVPDYDPSQHLAGVAYLFVRGMTGADTPAVDGARNGVFAWQPSAALVEELSDVLDAGAAAPLTDQPSLFPAGAA